MPCHICVFYCNSHLCLSGRLTARQKLYLIWLVKKFYQQFVCWEGDKWFREHVQNLGTYWNNFPLVWLWDLFYQYVKKNHSKKCSNCLKTCRCGQCTVYISYCNPLARHNGNNFKHFVFDWFILYYCFYAEDKTSFLQICLYYLFIDFLLYLILIWFG